MIQSIFLSAALVVTTIVFHYEALRLLSTVVPAVKFPVRAKVLLVVLGCFAAHTIETWFYAVAYFVMDRLGIGSLEGRVEHSFADYLYFSATCYSTVGFGDVFPTGEMRLVAGVEGINGLFLIAWSTSFTYFMMNQFWPLHPDPNDRK